MRITSETDYALRILRCIAADEHDIVDAKSISSKVGVPVQFTLKILRKLMSSGLVKSYKGATGGYALAKAPSEISMLDVVETVDGPLEISRCLSGDYECTRAKASGETDKSLCCFHNIFGKINSLIASELKNTTLDMAL